MSLLKKIDWLKLNPDIKVVDRKRVINLENGTTENDNPILIIGTKIITRTANRDNAMKSNRPG